MSDQGATKQRRLFCEISPLTYDMSVRKEILKRWVKDVTHKTRFAKTFSEEPLPVLVHAHKSLMRRRLNNVDMTLQENKAKSLGVAAPKVSGVVIRPGETFSFWELVGPTTKRRGYTEGLTIVGSKPTAGVGGGMCQFTNLLHWMVLHTDLEIVEHHHHNAIDLFPDFGRQVPFGSGTSIMYNYLDYRFKNTGDKTYQVIVYTTDEYLCGEIRCSDPLEISVHIKERDAYFYEDGDDLIRHNKIYRKVVDPDTGDTIENTLLLENDAVVMYDHALVDKARIRSRP